ncbi:hypothetical protein [Azospirillum brasilense]|uniref:TetR family transcriptional regulator n=1 Tax=Azospirillum brasilense TaxID=192 RepID=A0A235HFC8_AZOBR|nr:hypothetical protein [Azospirillum brasilense]OYD84518.1 hypothetical protein CHT98_10730 [Azospirillum brasilense]
MGITPQSLHAAFASKADLYREALDWHQATVGASTAAVLEEGDAVVALMRILHESAREFTKRDRPQGCMVSTAVLTCATENEPVARHSASLRTATLDLIRGALSAALPRDS